MSDKQIEASNTEKSLESKSRPPYVFLSHDTKDADMAEAFSRLLANVTAGVLKCFRSSDKKGGQGIQYGIEWFPELMKKLQESTDVVCILTENSINRPWILFEAGVAKGKLDTPILGLALGIPLSIANTGPFAQFQNSDDDEDSLVKLVTQLVRKIPGAEPDDSVVRHQVATFKTKLVDLLKKPATAGTKEEKNKIDETASVAKLFEEIKIMFNDLPTRIDMQRIPIRKHRPRRIFIEEMLHMGRKTNPLAGFVILLSLVRDEIPWIYDFGREIIESVRHGNNNEIKGSISQFHEIVEFTFHHPMSRELMGERGDQSSMQDIAQMLHRMSEDILSMKKLRR